MEKLRYAVEANALILHVKGELVKGDGELIIQTINDIAPKSGVATVILNLLEATGRTSDALSPLIAARNAVDKLQLKLGIAYMHEGLRKVFVITKLNTVIVDRNSINEAIRDAT